MADEDWLAEESSRPDDRVERQIRLDHSTGAGVDRTGIWYVSQEPGKLLSAEPGAECFQRTGTINEGAKARVGVKSARWPPVILRRRALAVKARVQGGESEASRA
jgi:hypothetical protein